MSKKKANGPQEDVESQSEAILRFLMFRQEPATNREIADAVEGISTRHFNAMNRVLQGLPGVSSEVISEGDHLRPTKRKYHYIDANKLELQRAAAQNILSADRRIQTDLLSRLTDNDINEMRAIMYLIEKEDPECAARLKQELLA